MSETTVSTQEALSEARRLREERWARLKARALELAKDGDLSRTAIAERLGVNASVVGDWIRGRR